MAAAFKSCIEVGEECLIRLAKSNSEYPGEAERALLRFDLLRGSADARAADACKRLRYS